MSLFRVEWSLIIRITSLSADSEAKLDKLQSRWKRPRLSGNIVTSGEPSYIYEKVKGNFGFSGKGSGEYAGSYSINSTRPDFTIWVRNGDFGKWDSNM